MERDDLQQEAERYHRALPRHIVWLFGKLGIPKITLKVHRIGFDGSLVTVPVFDRSGRVLFLEYWTLDYSAGWARPRQVWTRGKQELFGARDLIRKPRSVVVTEGVMEALALRGESFTTVAATGDGRSFDPAWATAFEGVAEVFVCFRRSRESLRASIRVAQMIPGALVVLLPGDVGEQGGIIDFFGRCRSSRMDFVRLLAIAPEVIRDEL